jgi:hypothetical protein
MSNDVESTFKWLHEALLALDCPMNDVIDLLHKDCLDCLANIIPHHCGHHESCTADICGFIKVSQEHLD